MVMVDLAMGFGVYSTSLPRLRGLTGLVNHPVNNRVVMTGYFMRVTQILGKIPKRKAIVTVNSAMGGRTLLSHHQESVMGRGSTEQSGEQVMHAVVGVGN